MAVLTLLAVGCAQAGTTDDNNGTPDAAIGFPDASPQGTPDAPPQGTPDAPPGTPQNATLTQTTADTVVAANSVACVSEDPTTGAQANAPNRYFRVFDLPGQGINSAFQITGVTFGVESAVSGGGAGQPATLVVHTVSGTGAPTLASLSQIGSQAITIADATETVQNHSISATVPAGSRLAIELSIPDGDLTGDVFFFGSNQAGESAPSYIVAGDCGVAEMSSMTATNPNNDQHNVFKVTGTYTQ